MVVLNQGAFTTKGHPITCGDTVIIEVCYWHLLERTLDVTENPAVHRPAPHSIIYSA
jgi:hypothetical protein